jgi:glycosyltransferase involved in cell wall biosynthesis
MMTPRPSALLVADEPGHLLERIGWAWMRHSTAVNFGIACSGVEHPFELSRRAGERGLVHWLDPLKFRTCGHAFPVPQVVAIHHLMDPEIPGMAEQLENADMITVLSKRWQSRIQALTGESPALLPLSVDSKMFHPRPDRDRLRAQSGIGPHEFALGFVAKASANVFGRKGLDVFEKIIHAAQTQWRDLRVVIVGEGWEVLETRLAGRGVRVLRRVVKSTEETAEIYPLMDAFLATSTEEGGPATILEAMACGVPVITTNVGHVPEVITDGKTGLICHERKVEEFIAGIGRIRQNDALRRAITAEAREYIVRERDDAVVVPQLPLAQIYAKAIARYRSRSWKERLDRRVHQAGMAAAWVAKAQEVK